MEYVNGVINDLDRSKAIVVMTRLKFDKMRYELSGKSAYILHMAKRKKRIVAIRSIMRDVFLRFKKYKLTL